MELLRKPYQGTLNIIRFNWHLYVGVIVVMTTLVLTSYYVPAVFGCYMLTLCAIMALCTVVSLGVSFYIYDVSPLYAFLWIEPEHQESTVVNIHAGFDEVSGLLRVKFENAAHLTLDFYDPKKHTEWSIKRARKLYPAAVPTQQVCTGHLPLADGSADHIFVIFAAHEIRDVQERILFFKELGRVLKPKGKVYVTEHMRDLPNLLAYNIGCLHFYSKTTWYQTFKHADLVRAKEIKITPFISTFILQKHGDPS